MTAPSPAGSTRESTGPRAAVTAHGLRVDLPPRWEARLYLRRSDSDAETDDAQTRARWTRHPLAHGHPLEVRNPVLHLANFPLPPGRGDFGTGAVELMAEQHVFVSLLEYDAEEAHRPLFAAQGVPRPQLRDFGPRQLQRRIPGQRGCQSFFTAAGRPFCLYLVLGGARHATQLLAETHGVLQTLEVDGR